MNVLLVSQCDKRALTETRRILDQFAERRGDRTWQTPITQAGLDTLRKLLRKTARKNTAVACHWIRGLDHSELMWIVGDARRFNAQGAVPTNMTTRNVLRKGDENDWHTAEDIRLLSQMAALLHDLGKASVAFQARLRGKLQERNLYRHEWVSLRLFQAFVGQGDDEDWLARLATGSFSEGDWLAPDRYQRDGLDAVDPHPFRTLPPLAAAVAWLVVTHHRLPVVPVKKPNGEPAWLGCRSGSFNTAWLNTPLAHVAHDWNESLQPADRARIEAYWQPAAQLPVHQPKWRAQAARAAQGLFALRQRHDGDWLGNPYVMHIARMSLMLADHHYSSLTDPALRVCADKGYPLFANTNHKTGERNQPLDEHLLGVAHSAGLIAYALPGFERHLPRLANHRGLRKRSADSRFAWQDKAFDAAIGLRESTQEHGAFIVNMASTGCGKTLANARLLYALADPQHGMRATYALGLRTLTLQTGQSYRADLHLREEELAIRVGGSASRALFEFYQEQAESSGSASIQNLIEEDSHVLFEGNTEHHPLLSRALNDPDVRNLVSAPMLVCTVDHLVPATESLRAGRQIAPMLRLMSSDLILDELDDYDLNDLPALTRLVHWAGMLGTRIVLSSATLPPALVEGMFQAYRAGRLHYQRNRGIHGGQQAQPLVVPCLWTDEFGAHTAHCADAGAFASEHSQFIARRANQLSKAPPRRRGELLPLAISARQPDLIRAEFARHVRDACIRLHNDHAETDPISGKQVSFGLVRMANIDPLFDVARALYALGAPADTRIHLCVYHARFPQLQRSAIEHQLDAALNRRGDVQGIYRLPAIRAALDAYPEQQHLFVVLASPVCEVGRDWSGTYAVAEPSSMRSLIQLAGRVQRHHTLPGDAPNVLIFDTNLKHFERADKDSPRFFRPGFEKDLPTPHRFRLESPWLHDLLDPDEYRIISALPRIQPWSVEHQRTTRRLVDLEHARIAASMLPVTRPAVTSRRGPVAAPLERDEAACSWRHPQAALTGLLPQQQPFRDDPIRSATLVFLPDEDEEQLRLHRVEDSDKRTGDKLYVESEKSRFEIDLAQGQRIGPWGDFDLMTLLAEQAQHLGLSLESTAKKLCTTTVPDSEQGWRYHRWLGFTDKK